MRIPERPRRGVGLLVTVVLVATQLAGFGAAPVAACDRSNNAAVVSHLGGSQVNRIVAVGNRAYAAANGAMIVFDVSTPSAPKPLAQVALPGNAEDIAVYGDFAYVVGDWGEMQIVDVADPAAPVKRGKIGWGGAMHGVAAMGHHVWVTSDGHGLKVIDVSDKDCPSLVSYASPPGGGQYLDIALTSTRAYVTWGAESTAKKVRCFDITDPHATPTKLGNDYTVPGTGVSARSIAVSGADVYLAEAARGLEVVDFTTPTVPVQKGVGAVVGQGGFDVRLAGQYAYLAAGEGGLKVFDVSAPAAPVLVGQYASAGLSFECVAVDGGKAYCAGGQTFCVLDVSVPSTPSLLGTYRAVPADAEDVFTAGDFAYVAAGAEGLLKVDITDTSTPEIVGDFAGATDASSIVVTGTVGFLADGSTIRALDVSPADPTQLDTLAMTHPIEDLFCDGGRLYVADGEGGLVVVDASDPADLSVLGTLKDAEQFGPVHAVVADGERVFTGIDGGHVVSVDADDPSAMSERDRMETYGDVVSLSLDGDRLWAGTTQKVYAIDASDPTDLFQLGHYYYVGVPVVSLVGRGNYAYAATEQGFYLVDFSDVANPYVTTIFGGQSMPMGGVAVTDDDRVFLAAHEAGLYEIEVPVLRTSGKTRYETAVELSEENWDAASYVVLATGSNYADAACAAPLAHALGGPLLLTREFAPAAVLDEIVRLGADHVIIIGSDRAVPTYVETQLGGIGIAPGNIERMAGWNRYDTARLVALRFKEARGSNPATAFVATGDNFPDALSCSGVAALLEAPVLLVRKSSVPTPTASAIADLGNPALIAVGSNRAISDAVYAELGCVDRLEGTDRYGTAKAVAEYACDNGFDASGIIVTSGLNFPDALVAGVVSAKDGSPILLSNAGLPGPSGEFIQGHADEIRDVTVVGSSKSVPQAVEDYIVDLLAWY